MKRLESLRKEREKVMAKISDESGNRAKCLIELMDIDDEMEEILRAERQINLSRIRKEKTA